MSERKGRPSASGMERLALCPGSWNLCKGLQSPSNADSETGDRIHLWLSGQKDAPLTDDELQTAQRCLDLEKEVLQLTIGTPDHSASEVRLWNNTPIWSGKADRIHQKNTGEDDELILLDWKTGRNDVAKAEGNLQLRALAVLMADADPAQLFIDFRQVHWWVGKIYVAIIAPWQSPSFTIAEYFRADLHQAREQINKIVETALLPNQQLNPNSPQCDYCPAKAICPAMEKLALSVPVPTTPAQLPSLLPANSVTRILDLAPLVENYFDAVRKEAKRRLTNAPDSIPGYRLKPGAIQEKVNDIQLLYGRLWKLYGITPAQFSALCSVSKTDLESWIRDASGLKGEDLELAFEEILEGITTQKQNAPSLEKVK